MIEYVNIRFDGVLLEQANGNTNELEYFIKVSKINETSFVA